MLLRRRTMSDGMGAVVYFLGVVRGGEDGKALRTIEYEAFEKRVTHQFNLLFDKMENRWRLSPCNSSIASAW